MAAETKIADNKGDVTNGEPLPINPKLITPATEPSKPPKLNLSTLSPKELLAALGGLSPAQLKAVGGAAIAAGLTPPPPASAVEGEGITLPDGRVRVTVTFDADLGAQLKLWAEAQGETLATFINGALTSYVQMDWQSMTEAPVAG
jgi:hypothetical protein